MSIPQVFEQSLFLFFLQDFERRQRDSSQAQTEQQQQQQQPQEKRRPRRRTVDFYIRAPKKRAMTAADYYNGDDADYAYDVVRSSEVYSSYLVPQSSPLSLYLSVCA